MATLHSCLANKTIEQGETRRLVVLILFVITLGAFIGTVQGCGPGRRAYQDTNYLPFRKEESRPRNIPELSERASGPFKGRILRDSPRFEKLVRVVSTDVLFKDDEGTGADRYMTKRCKAMLEKLAEYVKVEWDGKLKLRVIEAWDEDGQHAMNSLHYEGRAIDVTTSDRRRSRYGVLAALAYYRAGFDWTAYIDGHVHVSCRDDGVEEKWSNRCFPGDSMVTMDNGRQVTMEDLKVGDSVLAESTNGSLVWSQVIMFIDRKPAAKASGYVSLETETGEILTLTGDHLLFAGAVKEEISAVYARDVRIGYFVRTVVENATRARYSQVIRVGSVRRRGAYAPLTSHGTIVVDGVVASCYAVIDSHATAHASFAPLRLVSKVINSFSSSANGIQTYGIHWYPTLLMKIGEIIGLI